MAQAAGQRLVHGVNGVGADAAIYGGSNMGNGGAVMADSMPWQAFQNSMAITLPPLSVSVFKLQR